MNNFEKFDCAGKNTSSQNGNSKRSEAIGAFVMTCDQVARQRGVRACSGHSQKDTRTRFGAKKSPQSDN